MYFGLVVFGRNYWLGNVSIVKGQHLEIIKNDSLRWCVAKHKETQTTGFVLSYLLTNCPDAMEGCVVAKETFEDHLYLQFQKGDKLQITDPDFQLNGWWYALNIRTRQEGYVHPFHITTFLGLLGAIVFSFYGLTLHGFDVVTDILSGDIYLEGDPLPENDSLVNCSHFNSYSHSTWGSMSIGLAWLPAFPVLVILLSSLLSSNGRIDNKLQSKGTVSNGLLIALVCLLWPITSFLM